eukprot:gene27095-2319_t
MTWDFLVGGGPAGGSRGHARGAWGGDTVATAVGHSSFLTNSDALGHELRAATIMVPTSITSPCCREHIEITSSRQRTVLSSKLEQPRLQMASKPLRVSAWESIQGNLLDGVGLSGLLQSLHKVEVLASQEGPIPSETERHICHSCMDMIAHEMLNFIGRLHSADTALLPSAMGLLARRGYMHPGNAPRQAMHMAGVLIQRLQVDDFSSLTAQQLEGLVMCVVLLLPKSVTKEWCIEMEASLSSKLVELEPDGLANMLVSCSLLSNSTGWTPSLAFLIETEQAMLAKLSTYPPSALAHAIHGYDRLEVLPSNSWLEPFRRAVESKMADFATWELAMVLIAYSRMGVGFSAGSVVPPTAGAEPSFFDVPDAPFSPPEDT